MAESFQNLFKEKKKTVGKEENACYKQFLLFPECSQKTCNADT